MLDYTIILDGRSLRALAKKYNFTYDKQYKYITSESAEALDRALLRQNGYKIKYISGCFKPFLCKLS